MLDWIIQNKDLLKPLYALVIGLVCFLIVWRTHRLFKLSEHQGIRYFRNAFLFYGLAFISRYFLIHINDSMQLISKILFEFFLVMAGFFLLYSLIWKKFESTKDGSYSSLLNMKIAVFYLMTLVVVLLDVAWNINSFMFGSQVLIFLVAFIISFINFRTKGKSHKFLKFYSAAMFLIFITWVLNFVMEFFINWNQGVLANIYALNLVIFFLILYGVIKITKR
jgi:hypothetical protein